ncbi:signal transduction histidine kinase [Kitasatospora gansuensis]|uniref:histidine kinase n=1 Tax=Kitasatospora gansuensis TaxID=258050 RepID=A0A7W7S8L1_9ACTN|nr:histidine kinase [Kitasatospora gansuensis]MBB4945849.1 signal transduction histidine kinase [Kitasatospora gansuensis]
MSENESTTTARAFAAAALALLCTLVWVVLALANRGLEGISDYYFFDGVWVALGLTFTLSGLVLVINRSGSGLGVLLLVTGVLQSLRMVVLLAAALAGAGPGAMKLIVVLVLAADIANAFMVIGFPLWLPDVRLPGGIWRCITVLVAAWSTVLAFANTARVTEWYTLSNPLNGTALYKWLDGWLSPYSFDIFTASLALTLTVALIRWWRSPGPHPHLTVLVAAYLVWAVLVTVPHYLGDYPDWLPYAVVVAGEAAWMLVPIATFRRDRSLSLDRAARRYLAGYAFCTLLFIGMLATTYLSHRLIPGTEPGLRWWLVLVAAVLGALLRPAARFVVRAVDRYYYGERAHPYQVVRRLAERMSQAVGPAEAPPLLCQTVVIALGLPAASVRVRTRSGPRELARLGEAELPAESFPLSYEGAVIGELSVPPRSGQRELDRQDREVLRLLADQASPAIASLRLYEDLQASRKKIVLAREEERRRLRHDLHDGLGPALSGLRLQLDAARTGLAAESEVAASLTAASAGIGQAITELRRITDGLAPAALGSEGLAGALRRLADGMGNRSLRVTLDLDPDPLPTLPAAVEVAIYRISGEALNNVVRHSGAAAARLVLRVGADEVTVEATDDGAGFPAHNGGAGVGLRSMAERAEELGGSFTAANDADGAVVRAVFPRVHG